MLFSLSKEQCVFWFNRENFGLLIFLVLSFRAPDRLGFVANPVACGLPMARMNKGLFTGRCCLEWVLLKILQVRCFSSKLHHPYSVFFETNATNADAKKLLAKSDDDDSPLMSVPPNTLPICQPKKIRQTPGASFATGVKHRQSRS